MSANSVVNLVSGIWAALTVLALMALLIAFANEPGEDALENLVLFFIVWSVSLIFGLVAFVLRAVLDRRLTGTARWFGWIAPIGSAAGIVVLATIGHVVG